MPNIARFTPSIHDGATLEKLFVAREDILEDGVDRIRDASESGRLAHVLYTGPRGAGKTHLISLIHYRATQLPGYGETFSLAWLEEDPWKIHSFETFIEQMDLAKEHPDVPLTIVFAEGFDWILKALGPDGQRRLRARIERDANLLLITSSTRLTDSLIKQASPFYGFLDHIELHPFTLDEAIAMLTRAAEYDGDRALVTRLRQPDVRARLAAIAQLAGGQPRLWALLSAGLTVSNIDDMVSLLITKFDDLTPYYQEQLRGLSPTELQIVLEFIDNDRALTPKEVSHLTGIPQQTVASTIKRLNPAWVVPREGLLQQYVDKRLTYYQLAEPLARVGPQLKQTRGKPVEMVVDFLSAWFSRSDLAEVEPVPYAFVNEPKPEIAQEPDESIDIDTVFDWDNAASNEMNGVVGAIAAAYRREALRRAKEPDVRVREQWVSPWPKIRTSSSYPPRNDEAVVSQARPVMEALAVLQHKHSAVAILELPVALASLIEDRLATTSVGLMRIEITLLAVRSGGGEEWLDHALDALRSVSPEETRLAQVAVACLRALLNQTDAALRVFDLAFDTGDPYLTSEEWDLVATTLTCPNSSLSDADWVRLITSLTPHVSNADLPTLIDLIFDLQNSYRESEKTVHALCQRLSVDPVENTSVAMLRSLVKTHGSDNDTRWLMPLAKLAWHQCDDENDPKGALTDLDSYVSAASCDPNFDITDLLEIREGRALAQEKLGFFDEAISELTAIVGTAHEQLGQFDSHVNAYLQDLADALRESGRVDDAIQIMRDHMTWSAGVNGQDSRETLNAAHDLGYTLDHSGHVDEALRLYCNLNKQAQQTLGPADWIRRAIFWGLYWTTEKTFDLDLYIQGLNCLLSDDMEGLGAKYLEPQLRVELSMQLKKKGNTAAAIQHLREVLTAPEQISSDDISAATMELADLLERTDDAEAIVEASTIKSAIAPKQAEEFLLKWREELSKLPVPEESTQSLGASEVSVTKVPLPVLNDTKARTKDTLPYTYPMFRLDNAFLHEVGLGQFPENRQFSFLSFIYSELEMQAGSRLTLGMPDSLLDEFVLFADKNEPGMKAWLDRVDPEYATRESYRQWVSENPHASESDFMSEYGAMLWLSINCPDYSDVVQSTFEQIKRELRLVKDEILAIANNPSAEPAETEILPVAG